MAKDRIFTAEERESRLVWLRQLRQYRIQRLEQIQQDHKVKVAAMNGRIQQLDDMIVEVEAMNHVDALPDDVVIPPNDTDTFKE